MNVVEQKVVVVNVCCDYESLRHLSKPLPSSRIIVGISGLLRFRLPLHSLKMATSFDRPARPTLIKSSVKEQSNPSWCILDWTNKPSSAYIPMATGCRLHKSLAPFLEYKTTPSAKILHHPACLEGLGVKDAAIVITMKRKYKSLMEEQHSNEGHTGRQQKMVFPEK